MKFFAIIISLHLIMLSFIPCGDTIECRSDLLANNAARHDDHKHADEACSPFCYCSCCVASVEFQPEVIYSRIQPIETQSFTPPYSASFISYDLVSIWQPPKLG